MATKINSNSLPHDSQTEEISARIRKLALQDVPIFEGSDEAAEKCRQLYESFGSIAIDLLERNDIIGNKILVLFKENADDKTKVFAALSGMHGAEEPSEKNDIGRAGQYS